VALLWSRPLVVLVLFAVTMFSGLGRGKGGSVSEGRSEEETTSGDGPRVPIPGSGSGLFKSDSGEFQAVVIPYGTSQARIKKEGGEQEVGLFIPGMEGTPTVLDETGEKVDSEPLQLNRGEFYHSANDVSLPERGTYTLKAKMQPRAFLQHRTEGEKAGYTPNRSWWSSRT
jgi:hypothetical protein